MTHTLDTFTYDMATCVATVVINVGSAVQHTVQARLGNCAPVDTEALTKVLLARDWPSDQGGEHKFRLNPTLLVEPREAASHEVWDWNTMDWSDPRSLQDVKDVQWEKIKAARSQAEYAGFTWDGSVFDADAVSQQRITGAVTLALLNSAFSINWTLSNNSTRTLNAEEMKAVGGALGVHVATQFARAQALRVQLEAATTPAAVAAVQW